MTILSAIVLIAILSGVITSWIAESPLPLYGIVVYLLMLLMVLMSVPSFGNMILVSIGS